MPDLGECDRLAVDEASHHLDLSAVDHVAGVAAVALLEDDGARLRVDRLHLAGEGVDLVVRQRREQVELVEQRNDRVMREAQDGRIPSGRS